MAMNYSSCRHSICRLALSCVTIVQECLVRSFSTTATFICQQRHFSLHETECLVRSFSTTATFICQQRHFSLHEAERNKCTVTVSSKRCSQLAYTETMAMNYSSCMETLLSAVSLCPFTFLLLKRLVSDTVSDLTPDVNVSFSASSSSNFFGYLQTNMTPYESETVSYNRRCNKRKLGDHRPTNTKGRCTVFNSLLRIKQHSKGLGLSMGVPRSVEQTVVGINKGFRPLSPTDTAVGRRGGCILRVARYPLNLLVPRNRFFGTVTLRRRFRLRSVALWNICGATVLYNRCLAATETITTAAEASRCYSYLWKRQELNRQQQYEYRSAKKIHYYCGKSRMPERIEVGNILAERTLETPTLSCANPDPSLGEYFSSSSNKLGLKLQQVIMENK
ncbi:hypothetical protein J6590_098017 [Homalodisca vitripennis]|nr:hypothetical protein J6590_098017 [Homalodisca vitripennis]